MQLELIVKKLKQFNNMELMPPVNLIDVVAHERKNGVKLPSSFVNLLKQFNGGEIFIPGTVVYGVRPRDAYYSIDTANSADTRTSLSIPNNYLIIGKLNFGDLICLDLTSDCKVIQWNHESCEEFYSWDSIEDWLSDTIEDFEEFSGEKN